jgi:hypothetical protein
VYGDGKMLPPPISTTELDRPGPGRAGTRSLEGQGSLANERVEQGELFGHKFNCISWSPQHQPRTECPLAGLRTRLTNCQT